MDLSNNLCGSQTCNQAAREQPPRYTPMAVANAPQNSAAWQGCLPKGDRGLGTQSKVAFDGESVQAAMLTSSANCERLRALSYRSVS